LRCTYLSFVHFISQWFAIALAFFAAHTPPLRFLDTFTSLNRINSNVSDSEWIAVDIELGTDGRYPLNDSNRCPALRSQPTTSLSSFTTVTKQATKRATSTPDTAIAFLPLRARVFANTFTFTYTNTNTNTVKRTI
jgi:hypothetical protein